MGLVIIQDFLPAPSPGATATYCVQTQTTIRLPGQVLAQALTTHLRQRVLQTLPHGGGLLELVTLDLRNTAAANPLTDLLLDVARANSPLHIEVDAAGQLRRVANKATLAAQWQQLLPWLLRKHQATPAAAPLLSQLATQYAADNDRLEQALAHKGAYGVLLPGVYGLRPLGGQARTDGKLLHQFFPGGHLPLLVDWEARAQDTFDQTATVTGTGRLDTGRFDRAAFARHLDALAGPLPRPPALQVAWTEQYTVSRTGQGILTGEQTLRVGIPHRYEQHTHHAVRQVAPAAAPTP